MTNPNRLSPDFKVVGPDNSGWWLTTTYEQPGTSVPFDAVNGVAVEQALNTPTYVIDATIADDKTEGLYLVASGCLLDVEKLGNSFTKAHASGEGLRSITMSELFTTGTVLPLTQNSPFRLPPQEIGSNVVVMRGKDKMSPTDRAASIRRIEADLRPYGVHDRERALKFAARLGLSHGVIPEHLKADLSGTSPIVRTADRLKYAFAPAYVQEQLHRPLNKTEVIDGVRDFIATKLREHNVAVLRGNGNKS